MTARVIYTLIVENDGDVEAFPHPSLEAARAALQECRAVYLNDADCEQIDADREDYFDADKGVFFLRISKSVLGSGVADFVGFRP